MALAFKEQLVEKVPMQAHDVFMDEVVTVTSQDLEGSDLRIELVSTQGGQGLLYV